MNPERQVYDENDEQPVTRSDLRSLEGGGETSEPKRGHLKDVSEGKDTGVASSDKLRDAESSGGFFNPHGDTGSGGLSRTADVAMAARGGPVVAAAAIASGAKGFFWGSKKRRRRTIGGGLIGALIGGSLFGLVIFSGPAQLVQLSMILQRTFAPMDQASSNRINKLFGSTGARDVGETRLGLLGRQYLRRSLTDLKNIGIEFQTDSTGGYKATSIDTKKLASNHSELKGMSQAQRRAWLSERFGIPRDRFSYRGRGVFVSDGSNLPMKSASAFLKDTLGLLGDGKILTGLRQRVLLPYFDIHNLFHPFRKLSSIARQKITTRAQLKAAEEERVRVEITEPVETRTAFLRGALKDKINSISDPLNRALITTAVLCTVRSAADTAVVFNHEAIVVPAALEATDLTAVGEQAKSGQDISIEQAGGVVDGFQNDKGQTIWQGKALQALSGEKPTGPDLPSDYAQAFSNKTTADNIKNAVKMDVGGVDFTGAACSTPGLIVQGLANIALFIVNIPDGETGSFAIYAGEQAATTAAVGGIVYMFEHQLTNLLKDKAVVPSTLSGPLGGNLAAYGARSASNIGAIASGGIALSGSASSLISEQQQQQSEQQFQSKNFFARTFDINDYRSLVGRLAQSISPSYSHNFASAIRGFSNLSSNLLSSLSSIFLPTIQAAPGSYNWGFPQYGIPPKLLNDPKLANPYANSAKVARVLEGRYGSYYVGKAKACFGVEITNDSGAWDVKPVNDIDPNNDSYIKANCDNLSDYTWRRVILFVFDTRNAQALACYQGDDQSCSTIGMGSQTSSNGDGASTVSPAVGDAKQLAGQILSNKNIDLSCLSSSVEQDVRAAAAGQPGTAGAPVSSAILQLIATVGQQHRVCVTAIESNGQGHSAGSYHYTGDAVDFGSLDGVMVTGRNPPSLTILKIAFQVLPSGTGIGQDGCGSTPSLPSGWTSFKDTCNHLHVQVPRGTP